MGKDLLQDSISFGKGMIPQVDPINLPEGAYLDALNMMRNEVGIIATECGTSPILSAIPGTVVGIINADDLLVICSTDGTTSYIGTIDVNDTYTLLCSNNILKFNVSTKLSLEYKEDYKKDKILYIGGKGIKLRRINLSTITSTPLADFDKLTALFLEYELPITKVLGIQTGGEVPTGIYQFACRLVTDAGDVTGFGILSGLFPVIDSAVSGFADVKALDGAPPQSTSPNLLSVEVSNIDTAFKYIEPCVITYIGQANTLSIKSLGKKIVSGTSMLFNYIGATDHAEDILQEEVSVTDVLYTSGNYITQKDNTLLIAGVTEVEDTYDWQTIANSIVVTWTTQPLTHHEPISISGGNSSTLGSDTISSTSFDSYRNPANVSKYAGYKRGEVYSFTAAPIIKGRVGKAYHIPAMTTQEAALLFPGVSNVVKVQKTGPLTVYPDTFPKIATTVVTGDSVRYHRMPESWETPFVTVLGDQKEQHNALGLYFHITSTLDWRSQCDGFVIARENRKGKETRLAQGVMKKFYKYTSGDGAGKYGIVPNFNSMAIRDVDSVNLVKREQFHKRHFMYCSPDIITAGGSIDFTPTHIKPIQRENMAIISAAAGPEQEPTWECKAVATRTTGDIVNYTQFGGQYALQNTFTRVVPQGNNNPMVGGSNVSIASHTELDIVVMRTLGGIIMSQDVDISNNDKWTEFWDDRDTDKGWSNSTAKKYNYNPTPPPYSEALVSTSLEVHVWFPEESGVSMDLYELVVTSTDYYGNIYNKESFTIGYKLKKSFAQSGRETILCFGGDTYISKYAMVFKDGPAHYGAVQGTDYQAVPFTSAMIYFTLESSNNYYYRHYIVPNGDIKGSAAYYPKQKNLDDAVAYDLSLGNSELYNKQYSAQNTLQAFYTSTVDEYTVSDFPNRIIYSATSIEGEKLDSFRFFKINNFHDIPKQYGNITGLFTQGTDLYIHTEKALWKAFYNTLVTQATSAGDVVLGNGGAFSRPSIPLVSLQGGYAGCKDISASVGTPLGRFFYDYTKAKLYLLGDGLQEVSNPAVFKLLRDTIGAGDVTLGYDYGRKRVLLSSSTNTLSFKPELQSFDSRHTYSFSHFISRGLKDYVIQGSNIHYFDDTVIGRFFGQVYDSFIKVASVVSPAISKRYVSAEVVLTAQTPTTKVNSPWTFFKTLKMYSRERNTGVTTFKVNPAFGELEQFGEILVSKANNKFRFGFAPDIVDDINMDIQDPYNLKSHSRFTDSEKIFLPDMVDNHVVLEFTIDNNQQKEIKIQSLIINFDQNIT